MPVQYSPLVQLPESLKRRLTSLIQKLHKNENFFRNQKFSDTLEIPSAVAQWLRCCVTNRKVVGSIPAGVIENFSLT